MGEYADDYFRREVKNSFGFDPGSMYKDNKAAWKHSCKKCNKKLSSAMSLRQHMRDKHNIQE